VPYHHPQDGRRRLRSTPGCQTTGPQSQSSGAFYPERECSVISILPASRLARRNVSIEANMNKAQSPAVNGRRLIRIAVALFGISFAAAVGAQSTNSTPNRDPAGVNPQTGRPNPDTSTGVDKNSAANTTAPDSTTRTKVKQGKKKSSCTGLTGDAMTECAKNNPRQQQVQSQDRPIGKTPN
jgi:hypothetical protein